MAVRPPPITTAGSSAWRLASASSLNAPVSWSAIRKSDALRIPRMMLFLSGMIVGRPAPAAIATWSKPASMACSALSVPPKRTPPRIAKRRRRASVRCTRVRKFLSQRTVMPYSETPPNPASGRAVEGALDLRPVPDGSDAVAVAARPVGGELLDLQSVDAGDPAALVQEVVRERVPGGAQADDQDVLPAVGQGVRAVGAQRVPPRQEPVDLDAPGKMRGRRSAPPSRSAGC